MPQIVIETRQVLAGELHYEAMVYHALRVSGSVPLGQLGMNVKQWIEDVSSPLFQSLYLKKAEGFRGGSPLPLAPDEVCLRLGGLVTACC